jgi:centromere protein C
VVGTIPEPTEVLTERRRTLMKHPIPRAKSPIKTFLDSPARRNPSLGPVSSPIRGSIVAPRAISQSASVIRKLDFSNASINGESVHGSSQKRAGTAPLSRSAKLANGPLLAPSKRSPESDSEEEVGQSIQDDVAVQYDDSFQVVNGGDDDEHDVQDPESEPETQPVKKGKGKAKEVEAPKPVAKRGRPKRASIQPVEEEEEEESRPAKRTRKSLDGPQPVITKAAKGRKAEVTEPPPKKASKSAAPSKPKVKGRKPALASISEDSPVAVRGPPMPKSRGLAILRRETPADGAGFKQTRSGRISIKPVDWWRGERIEYSDDEQDDLGGRYMLKHIKGVVRAEDIEKPKRHRSKSKAPQPKRRRVQSEAADDEDEEAEEWEAEPGRVVAGVRVWDPLDPIGTEAEEIEQEVALSSAAIITRDMPQASFRFAKTVTMPFFGSGMVDLPPGSEKKQKNSRKFQIVFFVFYGRVRVSINETFFSIGRGGMFQVPRGNCSLFCNTNPC